MAEREEENIPSRGNRAGKGPGGTKQVFFKVELQVEAGAVADVAGEQGRSCALAPRTWEPLRGHVSGWLAGEHLTIFSALGVFRPTRSFVF